MGGDILNGNMIFAKRIKQLREGKGDSQESLAAIFNYSKQAVFNWEINGKIPRDKVLMKLAERYETSSDYLLGYTDDSSPTKATSDLKKPKDLQKILEQHEIMFNGAPLTEEDKQDILDIVELKLYKRSKELNKRKSKES